LNQARIDVGIINELPHDLDDIVFQGGIFFDPKVCPAYQPNSLLGALPTRWWWDTSSRSELPAEMLSAVIPSERSQPAVPLAGQLNRPVSCYAFFKGWLLLSHPPGCPGRPTSLPT